MIRRMSLLNTYYLGKRSAPEDADITGIPSKAKKTDLVTMLVEEDGKKKQDGTGLGTKVNLTESSGSLSKASETSSNEEGWIIEIKYISSRYRDIKFVGIFTSKEKAIENAKKAFANMDYFEDADGWDNKELKDYSEKIDKKFDKGCKGGVLFQMDTSDEGDEEDTISVSIYKCFIDKPIKSICKAMDDADYEEDDGKKKQDGTGGGSKVNPTESSGSLSKAFETSSKEEGWIIETKFISSRCCDEPDIKIVGIFTSKEKAIENAKKAFANMDYFEDADGWDNEGLEDYSKKIDKKFDKGCKGGVLFQMDISDEGDTISVSIYKCFIDKTIKSIDKAKDYDDVDSEEDDFINSDDESEYEYDESEYE